MSRRQSSSGSVLCLLILCSIITNCTDSDPAFEPDEVVEFEDPLKGIADKGSVNFEDLQIGQRSKFVFYEAIFSRATGEVDFSYHKDTLVIAITGKNSETWTVTEFLTEKSNSRVHPEDSYWGNMGDSVLVNNLVITDDSINFFRSGSERFVSFTLIKTQKFPSQLVSDEFPENTDGLPLFEVANPTRWVEYVQNYESSGKTFSRLNIYFDYTDMATDGLGFTYLYGPKEGLVRVAWVSYWSADSAEGWDLIPN